MQKTLRQLQQFIFTLNCHTCEALELGYLLGLFIPRKLL